MLRSIALCVCNMGLSMVIIMGLVTAPVQDIWGWFARTGSHIVDPAYLKASKWLEPEFTPLLYQDHCDLLGKYQTYLGLTY